MDIHVELLCPLLLLVGSLLCKPVILVSAKVCGPFPVVQWVSRFKCSKKQRVPV